jgi:hypothetical protein
LTPTGVLVEEGARRRRLLAGGSNETTLIVPYPSHWFDPRQSAVYATIPDPLDPLHADNRHLQDFHRYRHLSRYELQLRLDTDLELVTDWDGTYYFVTDDASGTDGVVNQTDSATSNEMKNQTESRSRKYTGRRYLDSKHKGGQFDNFQAVPLSQGYGTHYVNLWIGSPTVQRKTLIVDTGSHYTAFPCIGCENCGHHTGKSSNTLKT